MNPTRRFLLLYLAAGTLSLLVSDFGCLPGATAKDGGSDSGGHGSGGSDGSGSSGSNSGSNSGSSGSSGHGSGDDGGNDDNSGHRNANDGADDDRDDDGGSAAATSSKSTSDDHDRARDAVRDGRVLPLKTVLEKIDAGRLGRIIDVDLSHSLAGDIYRLKVRDTKGAIKTFRVDARSGTLLKGN